MEASKLTSRYCLTTGQRDRKLAALELLSSVVTYKPETGTVLWNERTDVKRAAFWNSRYAGRECGHLGRDGYRVASITTDGVDVSVPVHRLVWFLEYGALPVGEIDHINGDRSDNRISNLRDVERLDNCRNAAKRKDNTSGVSGAYWDKTFGCWRCMVRHGGRRHYVGVFHDLEVAARAIKEFRESRGFSERHGA